MSDDKYKKTQGCGVDLTECDECVRPAAMRSFCQQFHRDFFALRQQAKDTGNVELHGALLELFASVATDLALEGTQRPEAAARLMAELTANRFEDLVEQGHLKIMPVTPPAKVH